MPLGDALTNETLSARARTGNLPEVTLIDANARVGSAPSFSLGPVEPAAAELPRYTGSFATPPPLSEIG